MGKVESRRKLRLSKDGFSLDLDDSFADGDIAVLVVNAQRYGMLPRGERLGFDFEFFSL